MWSSDVLVKKNTLVALWRSRYPYAAQIHSPNPEHSPGSNTALGVSEVCNSEDFWQWSRLETSLDAFPWSKLLQKQFTIIINDGDIKFIANKFRWKYVRQDKVHLLVYRLNRPYFNQKENYNTTNIWPT